MTYLLDTNVLSELRKRHASASVVRWVNNIPPSALFISAITILEVERGILLVHRRDEVQAAALRRWFESKILGGYHGRILTVDVPVARRAAALHVPDPAPERDALIAATAFVHGMRLATRNTQDFDPATVDLVDPWA